MLAGVTELSLNDSWTGYGMLVLTDQRKQVDHLPGCVASSQGLDTTGPLVQLSRSHLNPKELVSQETKQMKPLLISPLLPYLTTATVDSLLPPVVFPLSSDHHLLTLVQYNVQRATLANLGILSLLDSIPLECRAALSTPPLSIKPPTTIPPSLRPTSLQQCTPHEYWIRAVPFSAMRDNLILNYGKFDEDELCCDLVGGLYEGFNDVEGRGIMVWGEPWSPDAWEISQGFMRKWGFLLKGCTDLIEATNRWRDSRDEERLVVDVSDKGP
jgi:hypothetical protein